MRNLYKKKWIYLVLCIFFSVFFFNTLNHLRNSSNSKTFYYTPITPEQFGATGLGKEFDTQALQKAINSGSHLILKSGATYLIDKPLIINHSIKIETSKKNGKPAIILQKNKDSALIFKNDPVKSTYVKQTITPNQSYVVLESTEGMKIGDLLHLKSDKLWYWDNRRYLTKGELHKITKIQGNKVYLESPTSEYYKIQEGEKVTATTYPEQNLELYNISFKHPKPQDTTMLKINYASNARIEGISVINSKITGILLNKTFHTYVSNSYVELGTTKEIPTGYGIQDYGGIGNVITTSTFKKVRRGVDFSGDTPSRYGTVSYSKAFGYKKGTLAVGNSGFGTHSTAEHILFENNYIENFNHAFITRGNHISIRNNILKGFSQSFVATSYGDNVKIWDNMYESKNGSKLDYFAIIHRQYHGAFTATENTINGLTGPFIKKSSTNLRYIHVNSNQTIP
ncbi:hypothetical protein QUF88_27360 [Bacillus sp. DX1.1]|uniref:hypothetical protein n=1 Tax=unclassified Bacillus (in: firmicutes) TaxID=185979 RepID=UPI0025710494|nr:MULTISPECIES: hypothetical protein [unclassified Bacillus (in: firmicutes)]MDM5157401.1 hypothetical protein [Bacillus sp. DX1.1]WJE81624.1 hypothetical protein QRE67_24900 [Bacillus sp. DX3.1]